MSKSFSKTDVTVTLTGEEWFALLARLARKPLSKQGAAIYNKATGKMQQQILAVSDRMKEPPTSSFVKRVTVDEIFNNPKGWMNPK